MLRRTLRAQCWNSFDTFVCLVILFLGGLQFVFVHRSSDYLYDTNYFELLKSVLKHSAYGFNNMPMTQLPPGFPYLLAALSKVIGTSYDSMLRVVTVSTTLALFASYFLLRAEGGRGVAAACSVLLGSAPGLFRFTTSLVFADMTFFFITISLLYIAVELDQVEKWRFAQQSLLLLWGALLVGTVLLKSAGIALLCGVLCWTTVSLIRKDAKAKRRVLVFLPFVMIALVAEGTWLGWAHRHQYHEWNVPGYHENYMAQLRLKNANDPELGFAGWKDLIKRPLMNMDEPATAMVGLFVHEEVNSVWYAPSTVGPLLLILLGLGYSFRHGGGLLEWYFVIYETMIIFWPWDFELRFFITVAPLAFLYAWRGACLLWRLCCKQLRIVGAATVSLALLDWMSFVHLGPSRGSPQARDLSLPLGFRGGCRVFAHGRTTEITGEIRSPISPADAIPPEIDHPVASAVGHLRRRRVLDWLALAGEIWNRESRRKSRG